MEDENEVVAGGLLTNVDRIEYTHHGATTAPQHNRGYTITITSHELAIAIKSYSKVLLTEKRPFTSEEFDKVLASFKNLKAIAESKSGGTTVGGSTDMIILYKDEKIIFKTDNNSNNTRGFSGAAIDLSYLAPDLEKLIDSTRDTIGTQ